MSAAPESRVEVWFAEPAELCAWFGEPLMSLLGDEERARHGSYVRRTDRDNHLVARAMVRVLLSRHAPVSPRAWRFARTEHGRPEIDPASSPELLPRLRFNLSHTEGLVVCAIAHDLSLGVDAERLHRRCNTEALARSSFAERERLAFRDLPAPKQRERFFEYWTLKESYIKARGEGLSIPLDQFWFDLGESGPKISFGAGIQDSPGRWQFARHRPTPEHIVALAVGDAPAPARVEWRSAHALLRSV